MNVEIAHSFEDKDGAPQQQKNCVPIAIDAKRMNKNVEIDISSENALEWPTWMPW